MTETSAPGRVEDALERYASMTSRAMEAVLPAAGSGEGGGLAELVRDYPARGGKGIRPALVMAACQAFGGSSREALGPAVAIELMHNAFLIHDDLEDESTMRRGRPTLHSLHGAPLAVNAGDALAVLALGPLLGDNELGGRLSARVTGEVLRMARLTTSGQGMELRWRRDNVVALRPADYFELILLKTCCYTTVFPLRIGALVGTRGVVEPDVLDAISEFGFYLGAAFQIRDDVLNLIGRFDQYGKERLGDLLEGKRTLMLIHLLNAVDGVDRRWLTGYLASPIGTRRPAEADRVLALLHTYGSVEFAHTWGDAVAGQAYDAFDRAFAGVPASEHLEFLRAVIPYMLDRQA